MCRCPVCQAVGPGEFWGASQPSAHPDVTSLPAVLASRLSCWQQRRYRALSCGGGAGGAAQWEPGSRRGQRGCQQAAVLPAGDQPDASLPLHVLPLYSLLAPEKQAQVTAWGPGCLPRVLGWGQGRPRGGHPIAVGPAPPVLRGHWDLPLPCISLRSAVAAGRERTWSPPRLRAAQPG